MINYRKFMGDDTISISKIGTYLRVSFFEYFIIIY